MVPVHFFSPLDVVIVTHRSSSKVKLSQLQFLMVYVNSLLSGSFLIKLSSLSAPTKIEELTAGSDEKTQLSG